MVIIPLTGKISWKNPPLITILIIAVNCFVFIALQSKDDEHYAKAINFYLESGLAKMEVARYVSYLRTEKEADSTVLLQTEVSDELIRRYYPKMKGDGAFLTKLENNEIIPPHDPDFAGWKDMRAQYTALLEQVFSFRYGFIPARPNLSATFIHLFTHGSFMHLLGNMIFLWLVGCVLELGCGRIFYLALYLLTGICAVGTFAIIYSGSTVPLIGASGAVSGLMGAFTVIYGLRKIRIFYSLGFYFDYAEIPAILLFPFWIAHEFYQLFFGMASNVAYVAHIGGLASGALCGFIKIKLFHRVDREGFKQDPRERIATLLENALARIAELDMKEARPLLEEVLKIDPKHRAAMTHLFNIDKLNPETETFQKTAAHLLLYLIKSGAAQELIHETYQEYRRVSKEPRLNADLLLHLSVPCFHSRKMLTMRKG